MITFLVVVAALVYFLWMTGKVNAGCVRYQAKHLESVGAAGTIVWILLAWIPSITFILLFG